MLIMGDNPPLNDAIIQNVSTPVLCCVGGKDTMVSITETDHVSNLLPNGDIFVFEEFEHPLERIDQSILAEKIIDYFK